MPIRNRTYQLGKLQELKGKVLTVKIRIDGLAKNIIYHFEPLDRALDYVESIDPDYLDVHMHDLKTAVTEYRKLKKEIDTLKDEVGEEGG